jgi:hypothetical protein
MNNKLILRTENSPFPSPYGDITKGSVLSQSDLDNNQIYLKGLTIYSAVTSGSTTTLYKLNGETITFAGGNTGGTSNNGIKYNILTGETVDIGANYEYLVYGDLTLEGTINNSGKIVIMNGSFINSGTYNQLSGGSITLVSTQTINKFSIITGITANVPLVITHNLGTPDVMITVKDLNTGYKIGLDEYDYNLNDVTVESTNTLTNIKITIIG